ncbi:MAG: amidohydrolase family protein [Thermoleophilia bacterium]|nr:amidohydrolase family protein [Thermoleophilia bacterium]
MSTDRALAPDLILTNALVYAADAARSRHEAVAVGGGRVVAVGSAAEVEALAGAGTEVVDLCGRLVLPGFIDAHMHASAAVEELYDVSLAACRSVADCVAAVARYAGEHPELPAVRGYGWSDTYMPRLGPAAADLDAVVPDRPVILFDDSYHSAWLNSAGLRRAGIGAATPDPGNGVIERLPDGNPAGTLREGPSALAERAFPPYTLEQAREGILHFQRTVAAPYGLTTVQDANPRPGRDAALEAFEVLQAAGELTARYCLSLWIMEDQPLDEQIAAAVDERARHTGPLVRAAWAKLFADGVIEGHTAVLKEPYADAPEMCGDPVWSGDGLLRASVAAAKAGFRLHYHAIGDAATALCLDAIEAAAAATGGAVERPLITHLQVVDLDDLPRFASLGAVAAVQPNWFLKEELYRTRQVPYLGEERAEREYPMRSLFDHGILVAGASDYPVPPAPDPLIGIQRGVLRRDPTDASEPEPLWPEEAVPVEWMLDAYTINAARALGLEGEVGSLEPGKVADLVVVSRDLLSISPEEITTAAVELTLFGGRPVYAAGPFAGLAGD